MCWSLSWEYPRDTPRVGFAVASCARGSDGLAPEFCPLARPPVAHGRRRGAEARSAKKTRRRGVE